MQEIGAYVKTTTNTNGFQFFKLKNNKKVDFDDTIYIPDVGRFFVKTAPTKEEIVAPINTNDTADTDDSDRKHKTDVYEKVIRLFRLSGIGEKDLESFNVENISIQRKNGRLTTGKIKCILCDDTKNINAKEVNNTIYWITSNFQKHLVNVHKLQIAEKDAVPRGKVKRKSISEPNTKSPVLNDNNVVNNKSEFETSVSLQILPATIGVEKIEENIFSQISTQNLLMYDSFIQNDEAIEEIEYIIDDQLFPLEVVPIAPDGNCIFGALAHQIFQNKVSSEKHESAVRKLRIDAVDFIKSNIECFKHVLKGRIYDKKDKKATKNARSNTIKNFEEECNAFLINLAEDGVWSGSETIKAVSLLYGVNILIVNESGCISYANGFNPKYKKTIIIAYRLSILPGVSQSVGARWNHYDSVANINVENIIVIAEYLAKNQRNESDHLETIEIDE